ncbi:MAG: UPF0182 family protein [Chloroflexota bacterium]|nr:UPF0182 family protein [Chloroflexota bacterium]
MDREQVKIPEVFQRAMEEYGWNDLNDDDDGPRRPSRPEGLGCAWWVIPVLLLGLLFLSFDWIVTTYTEWLWFTELGYDRLWLKQWGVQVGSFLLLFLVAALVLLASWHIARREARPTVTVFGQAPHPMLIRGFKWLVTGVALFLAYLFASAGASQWESFLRYFYAVPYGVDEPIFGQDISFYLFELPVYEFTRGWLMGLLFVAILGVIAIYAVSDWQQVQEDPRELLQWRPLHRHVAVLGALFLGLWALGYWLDAYELLFSPGGVVFGAGYTDVNATLLALRVQMVLMALVALAVAYNVVSFNLRLPAYAAGLWLVSGLLLGGIYPSIVQRYQVEPNELAREYPYLENNIEFTRLAFGLNDVERFSFDVGEGLSQVDLQENETTLENIRLWDYRPLLQTYNQLQALRPYYTFNQVDIDRYDIDGELRQVMLAARELDKAGLTNPSWVNEKLEFTHGYGIVMNPVDRVTREGLPEFFIRDVPPISTIPIEVERPEVYYGELTNDEVFVDSGLEEFDYPSGDQNVYTHYEGTGGVPLSSFLRRLAFAIRFGEFNVLLSEYITPETQVMFHRQIRERVQRITPFLALDNDPYIVVADGQLFWIIDAYTLSNDFPYSTPAPNGRFNYIRNAAKVTIDAYNGDVTYYLAAPDDPLVQAYSRAFPDLFKPLEEMPPSLLEHIRYPEDLFTVQTRQYLTYHMQDVQVFYNREDLWEIPLELLSVDEQVPVEPYYVISSLGEADPEFLLIQPYVPRGKNNMIAWIAARNDPPAYGQLVVYELPKQELVFGPFQIESRIDQEPSISEQISLWSQRGSDVLRGNLLVIPVGESFLYVEPLYLQSETSALPELKRVIVASGNRIIMRETLGEALTALAGDAPTIDTIVADPPLENIEDIEGDEIADVPGADLEEPDDLEAADVSPPAISDATLDELIASANAHFEAAEEAQRLGDWTTYGRELEALQADLERLLELSGGTLPAEASGE